MLRHPGIVEYLAFFTDTDSGSLCIVMEYCDFGSLTSEIQVRTSLNHCWLWVITDQLPFCKAETARELRERGVLRVEIYQQHG